MGITVVVIEWKPKDVLSSDLVDICQVRKISQSLKAAQHQHLHHSRAMRVRPLTSHTAKQVSVHSFPVVSQSQQGLEMSFRYSQRLRKVYR